MATLLDEFLRRRQLVVSVHYAEAKTRLAGLLDWMESQPQLKTILNKISTTSDAQALIEGCDYNTPPKASTPDEIASVGLLLMEQCRQGEELFQLAFGLGITPPYSTMKLQAYTDEVMQRFIEPTLDLVETKLSEIDAMPTMESLMENCISQVTHVILPDDFPFTVDRLQKLAQLLAEPEERGEWFNVGNSCREALKTFMAELQKTGRIDVPEKLKAGDVKNMIKSARTKGTGRFEETLVKLVASVWGHAQSVTHRGTTTKQEAIRVLLWTILSIGEIARAVIMREEA